MTTGFTNKGRALFYGGLAGFFTLVSVSCNYAPRNEIERLERLIEANNSNVAQLTSSTTSQQDHIAQISSQTANLHNRVQHTLNGGPYAASEEFIKDITKVLASISLYLGENRRQDLERNRTMQESLQTLRGDIARIQSTLNTRVTNLATAVERGDQESRDLAQSNLTKRYDELTQTIKDLRATLEGRDEANEGLISILDSRLGTVEGVANTNSSTIADLKSLTQVLEEPELGTFEGYRIVLCYDTQGESTTDNATLRSTLGYIQPSHIDALDSISRIRGNIVEQLLRKKAYLAENGVSADIITPANRDVELAEQFVYINNTSARRILERQHSFVDAEGNDHPLTGSLKNIFTNKDNYFYLRVEPATRRE